MKLEKIISKKLEKNEKETKAVEVLLEKIKSKMHDIESCENMLDSTPRKFFNFGFIDGMAFTVKLYDRLGIANINLEEEMQKWKN